MSKEFTKEIDGKLMLCTTDIRVGDDVYEPGLEFEGLIRVVDSPPKETDFSKKPMSWLLFDKAISEGAYKIVREASKLEKIPAAFDIICGKEELFCDGPTYSESGYTAAQVQQFMTVFASLHVEAALKAASDVIDTIMIPNCDDHTPYYGACVSCGRYDNPMTLPGEELVKQSILTAYLLDNIK